MGLFRSLRTLGLKSILSSALTLEEEIYDLYRALKTELAGLKVPPSLVRILDEELGHQRLLRDLISGGFSAEEMEEVVQAKDLSIHDPAMVEALQPERYQAIRERLEDILKKEQEAYRLFSGLRGKARIPFVRRTFRFLEEQERIHLRILQRLLGRSGNCVD
jgi:rubrerythrin